MFLFRSDPSKEGFEPVAQEDIELGLGSRVSVANALKNAKSNKRPTVQHATHNIDSDLSQYDNVPVDQTSSFTGFSSLRSMFSSYIPGPNQSTPLNPIEEPVPTSFFPRIKHKTMKSLQRCGNSVLETLSFSQLTYLQRIVGCAMFGCAGALMLFLCFSSLPALIFGGAAKFVLDYLIASFFFFIASLFIIPLSEQVRTLASPGKRLGTIVYVSASILLILACQSKITRTAFIILPLFVIHLACLIYHLAGFVPFGTTALSGTRALFSMTFSSR